MYREDSTALGLVEVYASDSKKSAGAAMEAIRRSASPGPDTGGIHVQRENVLVFAVVPGNSDFARRVRRAIAALG